MICLEKIGKIAEEKLAGSSLFVVDIRSAPGNEIELLIDSDSSVSIEHCAALSRAIETELGDDAGDFELTVSSAGIGRPLKVFRQYKKLIGRPVEVVLMSGIKITAELRDAVPDAITIAWEEMVAVEGKKRKQPVERIETYPLSEVKSTAERLDFK